MVTMMLGGLVYAPLLPLTSPLVKAASRQRGSDNLRQICQSGLVYASDHKGHLPDASDLPDYARILAMTDGLNDPAIWLTGDGIRRMPADLKSILIPAPDGSRTLDPRFSDQQFLFTVVIGGVTTDMPGHIPIAWTKGLDPETGTWSKTSPYSGDGGHVLFLAGAIHYYRTLQSTDGGVLIGRDGKPTYRILDALPPNARISSEPPPRPKNWSAKIRDFYDQNLVHVLRDGITWLWLFYSLGIWGHFTLEFLRFGNVAISVSAPERFVRRFRVLIATPVLIWGLAYLVRY